MTKFTPAMRAGLIARKKDELATLAKESDNPRRIKSVLPLLSALPSMRLVLSWPLIPVRVPNEPVDVFDGAKDWERMWAGVQVDIEAAAIAARIPRAMIDMHVREAQMHLWVFPDGTVSEIAEKIAMSQIAALRTSVNRGGPRASNSGGSKSVRDEGKTPAKADGGPRNSDAQSDSKRS